MHFASNIRASTWARSGGLLTITMQEVRLKVRTSSKARTKDPDKSKQPIPQNGLHGRK